MSSETQYNTLTVVERDPENQEVVEEKQVVERDPENQEVVEEKSDCRLSGSVVVVPATQLS